jgi:phosphoglycolate phosphatase-like HAD superfamily hydrolase
MLSTRNDLFIQRYLPQVKPFPGARDLLVRMREEGLELVLAAPCNDALASLLLEKTDGADLIRRRIRFAELDGPRSEAEGIKEVLSALELPPREAAFLGDTPYDEETAVASGIAFVGLRSGGWSNASFVNATALYESPAELLELYALSPFSNRW